MRYRAKLGLLGWFYVALACFFIVLRIGDLKSGHHNASPGLSTIVWFALGSWFAFGSQRILNQIFIYWEMDPSGLRERRLWSEKTIPWQEVNRVSGWMEQPSSDSLAVHYARSAPLSDSGTVIAMPEDRQQFLADPHRYAPQATFDV